MFNLNELSFIIRVFQLNNKSILQNNCIIEIYIILINHVEFYIDNITMYLNKFLRDYINIRGLDKCLTIFLTKRKKYLMISITFFYLQGNY
jgi:hypothetical protein